MKTSRDRLLTALNFKEPDRPPHFEELFEPVTEAFNLSYPGEEELDQSSGAERKKLFARCAKIYYQTINSFKWDAVLVWRPATMRNSAQYEFISYLKDYLGPDIPVGSFIWGALISLETIDDYMQFAIDLHENPQKLHKWAENMLNKALEHAKKLIEAGCDLISINSDSAFNSGPLMAPEAFAEFTAPYLKRLVNYIKQRNVIVIFHSDGNLMPILDQIVEAKPDVLHSIDPMAGMDIAEVKKLTYGKIALMGNVKCSVLQEGPPPKIIESADYALKHGSPGGGFIYSSSNTIFKGVPLQNYQLMLNCLHNCRQIKVKYF